MNFLRTAAACAALTLAGCSTAFVTTPEKVDQSSQQISQQVQQAEAEAVASRMAPGQVRTHNRAYAGGKAILNDHGDLIPPVQDHLLLNTKGVGLKLRDIATEIGAQTGIPVDVADDMPVSTGNRVNPADAECRMAPAYDGHLTQFLDGLATWCDLSWVYRDGRLRIQAFETATYRLVALPSSTSLKAASTASGTTGATGGGGGGSSGGGSSGGGTASTGQAVEADVSLSSDIKIWDELKALISSIAKPGIVEISPSNQTIVVVARHSAQANVKRLIGEINRRQLRQVVFNVQVVNLTTSDTLNLGLSLQAMYDQLAGQYKIVGSTPALLTASNAGSFNVTVQNDTKSNKNNNLAGSNAVMTVLQGLGHVANKESITVYARDGRPAPVTVARQLGYISQATSSITTGAAATSVQQSTLTIGLTLELLPVVLDDGQIILQYTLGLSELNALTSINTGTVSLQVPDVNVRSTMQEAVVSSGEALVLMGYQQDSLSQTDQGLPGLADSLLGFFGGSKLVQNSHQALVIIITPQVRENQVSGL